MGGSACARQSAPSSRGCCHILQVLIVRVFLLVHCSFVIRTAVRFRREDRVDVVDKSWPARVRHEAPTSE
jgi:hypothetical protein